jgi:hypothetical protein
MTKQTTKQGGQASSLSTKDKTKDNARRTGFQPVNKRQSKRQSNFSPHKKAIKKGCIQINGHILLNLYTSH